MGKDQIIRNYYCKEWIVVTNLQFVFEQILKLPLQIGSLVPMDGNPPNPINYHNSNGYSPLLSSSTSSTIPISSQHYLAEIKYPNIPEAITLDKIFNVLHKIRTTSKPLFYKWQPLHRPKRNSVEEFLFILIFIFRW